MLLALLARPQPHPRLFRTTLYCLLKRFLCVIRFSFLISWIQVVTKMKFYDLKRNENSQFELPSKRRLSVESCRRAVRNQRRQTDCESLPGSASMQIAIKRPTFDAFRSSAAIVSILCSLAAFFIAQKHFLLSIELKTDFLVCIFGSTVNITGWLVKLKG